MVWFLTKAAVINLLLIKVCRFYGTTIVPFIVEGRDFTSWKAECAAALLFGAVLGVISVWVYRAPEWPRLSCVFRIISYLVYSGVTLHGVILCMLDPVCAATIQHHVSDGWLGAIFMFTLSGCFLVEGVWLGLTLPLTPPSNP